MQIQDPAEYIPLLVALIGVANTALKVLQAKKKRPLPMLKKKEKDGDTEKLESELEEIISLLKLLTRDRALMEYLRKVESERKGV